MLRFLLTAMLATLCGCASPSRPGVAKRDAQVESLADEFLRSYLEFRPQEGTALGLHEYDGRITDLSKQSVTAELGRLREFRAKVQSVRASDLSADAHYQLRLLQRAVDRELFVFEELSPATQNPMIYPAMLAVDIYVKRDFAPLERRLESLQRILERAPALMANARENLEPNLSRPHVETAIEVASGVADFLAKDLPVAVGSAATPAFERARDAAVKEVRTYAEWLRTERLPKATGKYSLGSRVYSRMLRAGEMVEISPAELRRIARAELARAQAEFAAVASKIDATAKPTDVYKRIQKEHPTAENLIPDTAQNLEAIRQFLVDHQIIDIPSTVRAKVLETPTFMRATSFASMDTPGPFETRATEAHYYVTPVEAHWTEAQKEEWLTAFNYYTTDVMSVHEAYPGHYVQYLCLNASDASRLAKVFTSYAFSEGWAHYTEQMMIEQGFGSGRTPEEQLRGHKYHLAQLGEALLRLCRMCVSLEMHCNGMTVDEGTRFFQENAYYEEKPARAEATRGAYDPEYLYYTLGKLQMLKLREDYQRQEGPAFSLRKFHNEVLRQGSPPLRLLRERMLRDPKQWDAVL